MNEPGFYFDGDLDAAVEELFRSSSHGGTWYPKRCGGNYVSMTFLSDFLRTFLVSMDSSANSPTHSLVSENQEQAGAAIPGRYVANRLPDAASCSIYLGAKPLFHGSTCNGEPTTIAIWHSAYHLLSHPSA